MTNFFRMLAYVGACKIHFFLPCYLSLSLVELDIYPLFLIFFYGLLQLIEIIAPLPSALHTAEEAKEIAIMQQTA